MKVREWIPHIGPLTKVIPLNLFLDTVPSSSANITRTMRREPKRLYQNYRRRNGGNVIVYGLISFYGRDVLSTLSCLFVRPGFRLFCACLAVNYLAVYWVLGSLIKQSLTPTATSTKAVYVCVIIGHVRYINILTWLRGFRIKIVNFFSFFCLSIPKRDLDTKKTTPNIEICPESLGAMLEYWYIERGLFFVHFFAVVLNSREIRRLNIKSFLVDIVAVAA